MNHLEGHYFNGQHPIAVPALLEMGPRGVVLTADDISETFPVDQIEVSPRMGATTRFIALPNGGQFGCRDTFLLDQLPQESMAEGAVAWLEERISVAVASVALIIATLVVGYFWGLPIAAEHIAKRIPMETERTLGLEVLSHLDEQAWLGKTQLDRSVREEIRDGFKVLIRDVPYREFYDLKFRSSSLLGPNAFAFPGGIIMMTDQMVELAETNEEVLAVLAHEIGHVEMRHTIRSVMQNSVVGVIAATVTSDAASLSGAVVGLPMLVAQTKYSRAFETEADQFAFRLLNRKGYSPTAFADLMERLSKAGGRRNMGQFNWISSHPVTAERIRQAKEAAAK